MIIRGGNRIEQDHFLKVFIEFVTILLLFYVLDFWLWDMWDLSSPTRDQIHTPCIGRRSLNHWITREVPSKTILTEQGWNTPGIYFPFLFSISYVHGRLPSGSAGKESACDAGDLGSSPGLEISPGEGKVYLLQYSGLENSVDYIVHRSQRVGHDWVTFRD